MTTTIFERKGKGKGLVITANEKQFIDILFDYEVNPRIRKVEVLPPEKGVCRITIKYLPAIFMVPYEKIQEAVDKAVFNLC